MDIASALRRILAGHSLTRAQTRAVVAQIMDGSATAAQTGGLLMALRCRGETVDELVGAAQAVRNLAARVIPRSGPLIDTCGTGGSGTGLFNVSTAAAFVAAAAGARVAKHGNRAVSGNSGSADLLERAGAVISLPPAAVVRCIDEVGLGFMFAPVHHKAMKNAAAARRELGVPTLFNLLGPLTNPAASDRQVFGVHAGHWQEPMARAALELGTHHALVVHCAGLDELGLQAPSRIVEVRDGAIDSYSLDPRDVGLDPVDHGLLRVAGAAESLVLVRAVLFAGDQASEAGVEAAVFKAARDIVAFNAGAAIHVAGLAESVTRGVTLARDLLATGRAADKFSEYVEFTRRIGSVSP